MRTGSADSPRASRWPAPAASAALELTRSMKAQGKLSSWPNRVPIFLLELIDLSPSQFAQVAREHVPPRRPIMLGPAPDVQPMGDALGVEQAREGSAGWVAWLGGREQDHRDAGVSADEPLEHPS